MTQEKQPLPESGFAPLLIRVDAVYACFNSLLGFYFGHPNYSHAKYASTLEDEIRGNMEHLPIDFREVIRADMEILEELVDTKDEKAAEAFVKARQKEIDSLLKAI